MSNSLAKIATKNFVSSQAFVYVIIAILAIIAYVVYSFVRKKKEQKEAYGNVITIKDESGGSGGGSGSGGTTERQINLDAIANNLYTAMFPNAFWNPFTGYGTNQDETVRILKTVPKQLMPRLNEVYLPIAKARGVFGMFRTDRTLYSDITEVLSSENLQKVSQLLV